MYKFFYNNKKNVKIGTFFPTLLKKKKKKKRQKAALGRIKQADDIFV